ncbi:carboxypeptidase-like regulatory domain-containing protein [Polaribacter cellanae]|uniref:Carboxypeptidase-like regulatory domain-containing protein n=1 Tax=Polaribacter cellanae TaxID=2818493 RepID=A0A975CQD0_9FLAO|nr:hypothetical protein [Polaribacter cellanae]QTE22929.1 hypothetical protein J3359_01250 [Polaribacter cellanae]
MQKTLLFFLFITISYTTISQNKNRLVSGKVLLELVPVSDVHIVNLTNSIGTVSNEFGYFKIPVKIGDSLSFSHLNFTKKHLLITEKNISEENLEIKLTEKTVELKEITLQKPRSIFYVDKEILQPNAHVDAKSLNLPYANTKQQKDNSIVSLNSGVAFSVDNIINSLNGNNKRAKVLKKMSAKDQQLSKIRKYVTDDFFITDLQIRKENINLFLNYCLNKNILFVYKKRNKLQFIQFLINQSKKFSQKLTSDKNILSKN